MEEDPLDAAAKAVQQWIDDPPHEKNMVMNGNNVAAVAGVYDKSTKRWYFCQFFAKAPGVTSDPSG